MKRPVLNWVFPLYVGVSNSCVKMEGMMNEECAHLQRPFHMEMISIGPSYQFFQSPIDYQVYDKMQGMQLYET